MVPDITPEMSRGINSNPTTNSIKPMEGSKGKSSSISSTLLVRFSRFVLVWLTADDQVRGTGRLCWYGPACLFGIVLTNQIGINYFGQKGELAGCINDALNVKQFLCGQSVPASTGPLD